MITVSVHVRPALDFVSLNIGTCTYVSLEGARTHHAFIMATPRERNELVRFVIENNDEAMVIFLMLPTFSPITYNPDIARFSLETLTDIQCLSSFRFDKQSIRRLTTALRLPERFVCPNRTVVSGQDALCVLLRRLVYPNRLVDLEPFFGRPKSTLSLIINTTLNYLYDIHGHLLINFNQPWLINKLQRYVDAIHQKGAPLSNCFGFVDGTVRPICKPTRNQRVCYNGHKRIHSLKFQSVVVPDGMIANMFGPVEGRRHDCALLREIRLDDMLDRLQADGVVVGNDLPFALYGYPAYPIRNYLICPFKGANLTEQQQHFNRAMSSVREAFEWEFRKMLTQFAFLDFRKNLKVLLQPVAKYYLVGALLTNCHTCLFNSQTSQYFALVPPSLDEYLHVA